MLQRFNASESAKRHFSFLVIRLCLLLLALRRLKERQILAVTFFLQFIHRDKAQCCGVYAIALAGWCRSIVKNVTEMRIA